jgi:hypothetical protein
MKSFPQAETNHDRDIRRIGRPVRYPDAFGNCAKLTRAALKMNHLQTLCRPSQPLRASWKAVEKPVRCQLRGFKTTVTWRNAVTNHSGGREGFARCRLMTTLTYNLT